MNKTIARDGNGCLIFFVPHDNVILHSMIYNEKTIELQVLIFLHLFK